MSTEEKLYKYDNMETHSFAGIMGEICILTNTLEEAKELEKAILQILEPKYNPLLCIEGEITNEEAIRR